MTLFLPANLLLTFESPPAVQQELECPTLLGEVNTSARLTCLAVWKPSSVPSSTSTEEPAAAKATTSQGSFRHHHVMKSYLSCEYTQAYLGVLVVLIGMVHQCNTLCLLLSTELASDLLRTKRVRIATEEVILEDESKPKKKKDGGKSNKK